MVLTQGDIANPLDASYYKGQGSRQGGEREFVAIRKVAPGEYTDDGTASTLAARDYKSAADLMVASAREGAHSVIAFHPLQDPIHSEEISRAMGTGGKQGAASVAVCYPKTTIAQLIGGIDYELSPHGPNEPTGPLLKGSPTGGGHPLLAIVHRKSRRAQSTDDYETWVEDETANTLNTFDTGDVRTTQRIVSSTLTAANNPSRSPQSSEITAQVAAIFEDAYTVRRLTPMECERLQGFPDDYSQIPIKGKPAADGPRYKALGNSMAVPVMRWIGQRIAMSHRAGIVRKGRILMRTRVDSACAQPFGADLSQIPGITEAEALIAALEAAP